MPLISSATFTSTSSTLRGSPRIISTIPIRSNPRKAKIVNGAVVSATGVRGVRYRRQIELSTDLSVEERGEALNALDAMLRELSEGRIADFRMVIRGQQRATHSDSEAVSGRARQLRQRGFYFLQYHPRVPSRAMCGTSSLRIARIDCFISLPTRKTSAKSLSSPPAPRPGLSSTRSVGRVRRCWWPRICDGSPLVLIAPASILLWLPSDAGGYCDVSGIGALH